MLAWDLIFWEMLIQRQELTLVKSQFMYVVNVIGYELYEYTYKLEV